MSNRAKKAIGSIRGLAQALGRAESSLRSNWLCHPAWRWGAGPWRTADVAAMKAWGIEHLGPSERNPRRAALQRQKLSEQVRKLRAEADLAEAALANERQSLHDSAECTIEARRRAGLIQAGFAGITKQLTYAAVAEGLPPHAIAKFREQVQALVTAAMLPLMVD